MTKKVRTTILIFLLAFNFTSMLSQESDYINGILLDAKLNEPIAFATIRIKDRALGVISNEDGSFRIPIKFKEYGDILEVSSMGYQSKEILINDLSIYIINNIRLQPAVLELQEVVVSAEGKRRKPLSARKIVQKAIEGIPINYPENSFSTIGYYRDYQLKDGNYLNLNEAVIEIFDEGFDAIDYETSKVRIYDYKENSDFERDPIALQPYDFKKKRKTIDNAFLPSNGGNELVILRIHDAIRNHKIKSYAFVYRFENDFLEEHSLSLEEDTYIDDERLKVISIGKYHPDYRVFGKLYISRNDFAIHKMEYALYDSRQLNSDSKPDKYGTINKLIFEVSTEYKKVNNKMYLNYISFHNTFKTLTTPDFEIEDIVVNFEKKCFVVNFNNKPDENDAKLLRKYRVRYDGKRIKIKTLVVLDNQVFLYPYLETAKQKLMFDEIETAGKKEGLNKTLLNFKIVNIKDVNGNVLNKSKFKDFDQFREFFAQEFKPSTSPPNDNLFMNKNIPIFKDQPITPPDNFDDYWMNTPLQKIEQ